MKNQDRRVAGLIPPITTPFRDGALDLKSLRHQLDDLSEHVSGVLVGGSVGETASLTLGEREHVIRTVADHLGSEHSLVVSISDNAIEITRRLAGLATECGAQLLISSCPNYFTNTGPMLEAYFAAVSEFTSVDLCLYDNPEATGTPLSVEDIIALSQVAPRLTHIKVTDTTLGKVAVLSERTDLTIHAGNDPILWHHMITGAEGAMVAIPMIYPPCTAKFWTHFHAGDIETAHEEYRQLSHFIHCSLSSTDYPAVIKTILHHRGVIESPEVRLPLVPLSRTRLKEVIQSFSKEGWG